MNHPIRRFGALCVCSALLLVSTAHAVINEYNESFTTTTYKDATNTTADWNTTAGEVRMFPFAPSPDLRDGGRARSGRWVWPVEFPG